MCEINSPNVLYSGGSRKPQSLAGIASATATESLLSALKCFAYSLSVAAGFRAAPVRTAVMIGMQIRNAERTTARFMAASFEHVRSRMSANDNADIDARSQRWIAAPPSSMRGKLHGAGTKCVTAGAHAAVHRADRFQATPAPPSTIRLRTSVGSAA